MRKLTWTLLAVCMILVPVSVAQAAVTPEEQTFIVQHVGDLVKMEPTRLNALAVEQVFSAPIYSIKVTIAGSEQSVLAARTKDALVDISLPSTNATMPQLQALVNAKFTLSNDKDAETFQNALDALYPINTDFSKDDLKVKAIKHTGQIWTFVRGKFFEHFKGFVVTTDAAGAISNIKYSLSIGK